MTDIPNLNDIPRIIADRKCYDDIVYTPLPAAYEELMRRRNDAHLERAVLEFLDGNVLEPMRDRPRAVIARSVVSPNYEVRRFADLVQAHGKLKPLYLEFHADTYAPINPSKHMLGRLFFYDGKGKGGGVKLDSLNILDFSCSNGRRFSSLTTLCGHNFIEFHHELFDARYRRLSHTFYDTSRWLHERGRSAKAYYRSFLSLFIRHGVLFENVLLNDREIAFTSHVFLPAFVSVYRHFRLKPLIVPLAPLKAENSRLWMCYPKTDKRYVVDRMHRIA